MPNPLDPEERDRLMKRPRPLPVLPTALDASGRKYLPLAEPREKDERYRPDLCGVGDDAPLRPRVPALRLEGRGRTAQRALDGGVPRSRPAAGRPRDARGRHHRRRGVPARRLARHPRGDQGGRDDADDDDGGARHHEGARAGGREGGAEERQRVGRWRRGDARPAPGREGLLPRRDRRARPLPRSRRRRRRQLANQPPQPPVPRSHPRPDDREPRARAGRSS